MTANTDVFTNAAAAYRHISFDPDRRADTDRRDYLNDLDAIRQTLAPLAQTDEQCAVLETELDRYATHYQRHYAGIYAARSRTASTMITGGSNFNHRRNQKHMDIEHRRVSEFLEWREHAQAAIKRAILDARTDEQKSAAMTSRLIQWAQSEMDTLESIRNPNETTPAWYRGLNPNAFTTSFTGKIHREWTNGNYAEVQECLRWVAEAQKTLSRPFLAPRNKVWQYLDMPTPEPVTTESATIYTADGVTVTRNTEADRYQIQHDEKPDETTRNALKREGWRWSPRYTAWQRQITPGTEHSIRRLYPDAQL